MTEEEQFIEELVRAFLRGVVLRGANMPIPENPELRAARDQIVEVCGKLNAHMSGPAILWAIGGGLEQGEKT